MTRRLAPILLLLSLSVPATAAMTADSRKVAAVETIYADVMDAQSITGAIDSELFASYRGKGRVAWERDYRKKRKHLAERLARLPSQGLSADDAKAVATMRTQLATFPEKISAPFTGTGKCQDANRKDLDYAALRKALTSCFVEIGGKMAFENGTINRQTALDLLHELPEVERRKAVFTALGPLWLALNGKNEPDSPYRRMIAMTAADAAKNGSEIDRGARDVGVETAVVERWLEQILDAWRQSTSDQPVEPWSFSYQGAEADRLLAAEIPRDALMPINQRFYQDLGADLKQLGALYELDPKPGKAALAYTDFVVHGRMAHGAWQPTVARVSAPYAHGGLFVLNELVHENGHVINIMAIRNRSAFVDWPSSLFAEAFADVPGWSTYEPAWQHKYLGHEATQQASLRALFSVVILDVAWSLFELRMLRAPATDPNVLWTEITSHYLHIIPHPELSWWALRVQLTDLPGYMVNYGLGAVLTADMRQRIGEGLGSFDTGDPRWYGWLGDQLLRYGSERDTRTLLQDFLGRPTSPDALLRQIKRMAADPK
ncbi:MAG: hypothetical protein HY010_13925 [Acidobacteria bacterium]|nr:hypothetical protein [Acidobacteriota bacterium]